jgi:hypothetical protein
MFYVTIVKPFTNETMFAFGSQTTSVLFLTSTST